MNKIIKQPGFSFGWNNLNAKPDTMSGDFLNMRGWQEEAFDKLGGSRYSIINAPMGSGKTLMMCFLSAHKMKADKNLRTIIAVPQTIIAPGFSEANLLMPDGEELRWLVQNDLCMEKVSEGTANRVIDFLKGPNTFFADRILTCTHMTLVAVYKKLKDRGDLNLLSNLMLWIDEAHHLKNQEVEGFEGAHVGNEIGNAVSYLLRYGKNVQIGLATATFFRGDRSGLLTENQESKFERFNLPYDKYLESISPFSFSFDFMLCGPDYEKAIGKILKHEKKKDIIYIPHTISKHSTGDKYGEIDSIINEYKKAYGGRKSQLDSGLTVLKKNRKGSAVGGELKILDLVDEDSRKQKKEYISSINEDREHLDAIIAMGMFKEGANWIWAERSIIVGSRSSLTDIIQMIGRLFRKAEGKTHVQVIQLLPFALDQVGDEKELRDNLNNYLKAIYASLILENILNPVRIISPATEPSGETASRSERRDFLGEEITDGSKHVEIINDISDCLQKAVADSDGELSLWDEYTSLAPAILSSYGVRKNHEQIMRQIWAQFSRRSLRMKGIDLDSVDFDALKQVNPIDFILDYTSGSCNISTLRGLRDAIKRFNFLPYREAASLVRSLNLVTCRSYIDLITSERRPAGLPRSPNIVYKDQGWAGWNEYLGNGKTRRGIDEWILIAEELAEQHGGIVPGQSKLKSIGFAGLSSIMHNNPEKFSHLDRVKSNEKTIEEMVKLAEELSQSNGGKIPECSWLDKNGYTGLSTRIRKYPDSFSHLEQDRGRKTIDEWVVIAEELSKKNDGILPHISWIIDSQYLGLHAAMKKYPESFSHIKSLSKEEWRDVWHKETLDKRVKIAERLASDNGGFLPTYKQLLDKKENGVMLLLKENPELIDHIERKSEDDIRVARELNEFLDAVVKLGRIPAIKPYKDADKITRRLINYRRHKKSKNLGWKKEYEDMAKDKGFDGIFDTGANLVLKSRTLKRAKEVFERSRIRGCLPRQIKGDRHQRNDSSWICQWVVKGPSEEMQSIAEEYGFPNAFKKKKK